MCDGVPGLGQRGCRPSDWKQVQRHQELEGGQGHRDLCTGQGPCLRLQDGRCTVPGLGAQALQGGRGGRDPTLAPRRPQLAGLWRLWKQKETAVLWKKHPWRAVLHGRLLLCLAPMPGPHPAGTQGFTLTGPGSEVKSRGHLHHSPLQRQLPRSPAPHSQAEGPDRWAGEQPAGATCPAGSAPQCPAYSRAAGASSPDRTAGPSWAH